MELTDKIKLSIVKSYCIIFFFISVYRIYTHQLLFQINPPFFLNRLDFTSWLVMNTSLHKLFLHNKIASAIFDLLFFVSPHIYYISLKKNLKVSIFLSFFVFIINLLYANIYSLYASTSIEPFIAIILFPLICLPNNISTFWFTLQSYRYFFLYFFTSAGIWKIVQGGIFNVEEMSSILLNQHKELFISLQYAILPNVYKWLIAHSSISYCLYFAGTLTELSFIIGFFTLKLDKMLLSLFILFLTFNLLIMQINYCMVLPFIISLIYSNYKIKNN